MKSRWMIFILTMLIAILAAACQSDPNQWSADEKETLRGLWIGSLKPLPRDPSNRYADDERAAKLGQQLFFDTRFSSNGKVACATCHQPDKLFQDGLPLSNGVGTTNRRAMTIVGTTYSPWLFWDGRKDSQWAQATGPMESAVEHGGNRGQYAHLIHRYYHAEYEAIFGALPDLSDLPANAGPVTDPTAKAAWNLMSEADRNNVSRIYANMGKAIAAYERKIMPGPAKFDQYVEAIMKDDLATARSTYTPNEAAGLRLFISKGDCTNCHNGPLFSNNDFHNTGVPAAPNLPEDTGRAKGIQQVVADEFNCVSPYSDAGKTDCGELRFIKIDDDHDLTRQFKPPSLRNVAERAPYMDAGQFKTLEEVLNHYSHAPAAPAGHSELKPLNLSDIEKAQLIAFLKTLSGPLAAAPEWLMAPSN
jgi:cytochrome c peroxidase